WGGHLPGERSRSDPPPWGLRDTARAMSQENVEIVRRIYGEWGRGNFREGAELYDPHVLLVVRQEFRPGFGGGGVLRP
ncbi:MAG TPA: hypothetical protein VGJ61_08230, partial [Solirubrobacterales bacterium]